MKNRYIGTVYGRLGRQATTGVVHGSVDSGGRERLSAVLEPRTVKLQRHK